MVYMDGITIFSKLYEEHIEHLKLPFEKCMKYEISLNPNESQFTPRKGKLLGNIVSHEGVKIDLK